MAPTLGGGTQDTDFNKGFTIGMFTTNLRRRNGGGQGDPDPLIINHYEITPLHRDPKQQELSFKLRACLDEDPMQASSGFV